MNRQVPDIVVSGENIGQAWDRGGVRMATEPQYFETGSEPEYFVTHTRVEAASAGNVRVFCYAERRKGEFHLLYSVVIPNKEMAEIARRGLMAAVDAHNVALWDRSGMTEQ